MELSTHGIQFYPEYAFAVWYQPEETFQFGTGAGERLRLVLAEQGSGLLEVSGERLDLIAPALICLNEKEEPHLEQSAGLHSRAVYFHPAVINSAFTFESIRQEQQKEELVYWQDRSSLRPFLVRQDGFNGLLPMGPVTARRAAQLFNSIRHQLHDQPDNYWVCRSRSFLLELLSLAEQLVMTPEHIGAVITQAEVSYPPQPECSSSREGKTEAESIILFLHAHYAEKITIPALVRAFHTNRTTLTEQFHRATSMPVMAYLTQLRMRQASLLLRDTVLPVAEIMQRVGYQDSTHFWRTFHKHIGVSPTEYRQRYCWLMRPQ